MYMVGTPRNTVTRSFSMIESACSPSNLGSSVRHAPPAIAQFRPTVWPKEWKSGNPPKITSPGRIGNSVSMVVRTLRGRLWWVSWAPVGWGVGGGVWKGGGVWGGGGGAAE